MNEKFEEDNKGKKRQEKPGNFCFDSPCKTRLGHIAYQSIRARSQVQERPLLEASNYHEPMPCTVLRPDILPCEFDSLYHLVNKA